MSWKLKSGEAVADRFHSHLHEGVVRLLPDALAKINSEGREFLVDVVGFDQPIGETTCVATAAGDQVIYAKRPKRWGHSRFVLNRTPESCSSLVVILKAGGNGDDYVLITAFVGHRPQPEPWDQRAFAQQPNPQEAERLSREFWAQRALVWGSEPTIPGTETAECPW